jgi:glycosyltransferase involved in cell wall biosynthesis
MISVLLPYRDAGATIDDALASVLADLAPDDELVAIDDGSSDDSMEIVRRHAARDSRVAVIATTRGARGIAAAMTAGLAASRGDLVARMDADDVSLPGRFAASRALIESDPSLGAVGTQVEAFVDVAGAAISDGMDRYVTWQNAIVTKEEHDRAIFIESPLCNPSVTMRRSALDAIGGFHDPPWPEDWDVWLRMNEAGIRMAKVPRVLLRWRRHAGAVTVREARYSLEGFREARAHYLARALARAGRPFAMWGAGPTGRRLARALEAHGARPIFFIDFGVRKTTARGLAVFGIDQGIARARAEVARIVVAVGAPGARAVIRPRLEEEGLVEGADYLFAA